MDARAWRELGISGTEAALTVVTAAGIYAALLVLSRLFGQRQLSAWTSYDLAFIFALGSLAGRTVLVRTSLACALLGLTTLFVLHSAAGWLHHRFGWIHRLLQNDPILVMAHGRVLGEGLRAAGMSPPELWQELRLGGVASAASVQAAILERNGRLTVLPAGEPVAEELLEGVRGREALQAGG